VPFTLHALLRCTLFSLLRNLSPPCSTEKLTFRDVRSPQEFRQNDVAEVVCDVTSSPVPVVSWFYNNVEILEDSESKSAAIPTNNYIVLR